MPKVSKKEEKDKKTDSKKSQRKVTKKTSGKKPTVKTIDKKPDNTKNKDEYLSSIFTPKTVKSKFDARNEKPKKANILDTDKTVVLPSAPSPRLLEKARVYKLWYEINSSKVIARVARFGGYVFVLLGSGLLMTTWATANTSSFQHLATTVCSETGVCIDDGFKEEEGGGTTADLPSTENLLPSVNFLSALSAELSTDTEFIVQGLNVTDLILNLYSHSDGSNLELHKKRITEGSKYYFLIPAKSLPAGEYTIKAKAIALDEETKHFFTGPEFAVPKPTEESVEVIDTASTTEDINDENSQKTKSEVNDNEKEEEEDKSITNKDKEEDDIIKEEINSESDNLATESTENEIINKVEEVAVSQFSLNIQKTTGSNEAKLVITGDDLRFVEIYAIPEMSTISRFLGLAKKVDDKWHYFVEYNHIPKGKYKLFASTKIKDETKNSNSVFYESKFEAKAEVVVITSSNKLKETDAAITTEKIKRALNTESTTTASTTNNNVVESTLLSNRENYFSSENNLDTATSSKDEYVIETERLLNEHSEQLDKLFKHYASAIQSGDEIMIRIAKQKFNDYRNTIITEASFDQRTKDILVQIDKQLEAEFSLFEKKVEQFENIISERTNELSAKDEDGDGISDFDELNIYHTDPNNTDTDGDGILDGVEIMGGFNPLDSNQEAIVRFHSPKNNIYTNDDIFVVEKVSPIIQTDDSYGVPVQAEIRGRGLPNSFVTLFIFSEPTIVTVKTEDDGSFVYTFTKELEDGEHEIYVALTDNNGEIVAQSSPFRFVKTAEAFSPVNTENLPVVKQKESKVTTLSTYNMVASMGVVTFGFILLMLGQTLRPRTKEEEMNEEKKEVTDK